MSTAYSYLLDARRTVAQRDRSRHGTDGSVLAYVERAATDRLIGGGTQYLLVKETTITALRLALAQIDARVGDINGNVEKVLDAWHAAHAQGVDVVVFTELTIPGYPPEDLLLKSEFVAANLAAIERLADQGPRHTIALVGFVGRDVDDGHAQPAGEAGDHTSPVSEATGTTAQVAGSLASSSKAGGGTPRRVLTNSAAVLADGRCQAVYDKWRLPNYGVFDEARYFTPRNGVCLIDLGPKGVVGVTICEDLWTTHGAVQAAAAAGANLIANLNASPYHRGKRAEREHWLTYHANRAGVWLAYCNVVGGQDDVVFDGDSMIVDPQGGVTARCAQFAPDLVIVDVDAGRASTATSEPVAHAPTATRVSLPGFIGQRPALDAPVSAPRLDPLGEVWHALVAATRDYCRHNGFQQAIVGLSGGIDSAVTAAIAVDALGATNVTGVAMPSPYSSQHSMTDALQLADALGCELLQVPITEMLAAAATQLDGLVATRFDAIPPAGLAYENLQSRLRGLIVMALSNERGAIVLTTGNKSEYAVGYATLYGDMSGGFAPLKDVPKLLVYDLARWRNREDPTIPASSLDKPPSAELRPDQRDQDSLPDYSVLDGIVAAYVEDDLSIAGIVAQGYDEPTVRAVVSMIDRAEFKRRQAAPGPKITRKAFGRDRRVPITNAWRD